MHASVRIEHRQHQTLSPRLQQAVRLLQMSSLDYASELQDLASRNPFLEGDAEGSERVQRATGADGSLHATTAEVAPAQAGSDAAPDEAPPTDADADASLERDPWLADGSLPTRPRDEEGGGALEMIPLRTGLRPHLQAQLDLVSLPARDLALARAIVESLDDDGYLRQPLDELVGDPDLDAPNEAELQIALRRVQSLDPAGVAARSVAECLLLQLASIACPAQRATARTIVAEHLPLLAARDTARLAHLLGADAAHVEAVCERIRQLDPHPGWRFDTAQTAYVTPDVVVKKVRGQWTASLNAAVVPRLRVNRVYAEMFQRHRSSENGELAAHLQEARWTMKNVEQRFATILSVAQAIVRHQRRYFELGAMAMKPLGLKQIADETGMHESTVSRVTNNKYMATPLGLVELKYFFSRAMTSTSGNAYSGTAVRGLIREMIAEERADDPLSDAQIARLLAQQGLAVARRTVTKYRQALHIEAVERRRAGA
jgi:RNA polymerase sigma-54 factor